MAKKKSPSTAEDKLRALFDLQIIDSRIDRLRVVRGEPPLEGQELEDELGGLPLRSAGLGALGKTAPRWASAAALFVAPVAVVICTGLALTA